MPLKRDVASFSLAAAGQLGEFPEDLRRLSRQTWFADGVSLEEAAFITTLMPLVNDSPQLYGELLETRFTLSGEFSLPLAGDVSVWAFQNVPFPQGDDLLGAVGEAARMMEQLVGAPFPSTDLIMLVVAPNPEPYGLGPSSHVHTHIRFVKFGGEFFKYNKGVVRHEIAHHFFNISFAPVWLSEGAANYAEAHILDTLGGYSLDDRRELVSRNTRSFVCEGMDNIVDLNRMFDRLRDTPECAYMMGENFLLQARHLMGKEALHASLKELYELIPARDTTLPPSEGEIYHVFLKNTPDNLKDDFHDLYGQLHGGKYDTVDR